MTQSADQKIKPSVSIVYTGEGKGKTSAGIGLVCRTLGHGGSVAFIQFIKLWRVSEHVFFKDLASIYSDKLLVYVGGKGFYQAGDMSARHVSLEQHRQAALDTYQQAIRRVSSGHYSLVICDEVNNAVHDGLLTVRNLSQLIASKHPDTSLCLTGRNFPDELIDLVDIVSNMTKIRHHYDDGYLANVGIDY